jgi:hypothetical protein
MPTQKSGGRTPSGDLLKPVAIALAVKLAALVVLYVAFFTPTSPPTPARTGAAILGLPTGR